MRPCAKDAEAGGYHLNPDVAFAKALGKGLLTNRQRYGYANCPCRLAMGTPEQDQDIVCPCDYRDADVAEYGTCFCGLYVSDAVLSGRQAAGSIPERRPPEEARRNSQSTRQVKLSALPYPVWRCKVCGYLCARGSPPDNCPICKASKERFERFI
jgi:ferredoxin-thioredoxin reductase catalytic subunit